jgi:BASS family bile acid:Na+ symporter
LNAAKLIGLGLNFSMALMVFSVALRAGMARTRIAFEAPGLLARALVSMYIVMPAIAVAVALAFDLSHALKVALVLLALSPVPPILPGKQMKVGGSAEFVLGLLVVAAAAAILVVPAGVALVGRILGRELDIPFGITTSVVATSVLLPVAAGLVVGRLAPRFAEKAARPLSLVAMVLLLLTFLPILYVGRHALAAQLGGFTVVAIVLFTFAGLAVGHLLGGPNADDRSALALATATRHPGVALAILNFVAPDDKAPAVVVVLYLLVGLVAAAPYVAWRKRARANAGAG